MAATEVTIETDQSKDNDLGDLTDVSWELLYHLQTTKAEIALMQACLGELQGISRELGQSWKMGSFGSAASGFHTRFSDLDVTCYQTVKEEVLPSREAMAKLHPLVTKHGGFAVTEVISSARIPILRLRYDDKLDVDVSFQNTEPLRNTQLLRAYARLSATIRHLVVLIKSWANAECVCGAQDGHLSSYSFTLMTLYYLQVDPLVKLPCFPTDAFPGEKSIPPVANIKWQCPLSLQSVICRFFRFYATEFYWGTEVASVRTGARFYTNNAEYCKLASRDDLELIHVEDPFLLHRNLNCVLGREQCVKLCSKLCAAHGSLQ